MNILYFLEKTFTNEEVVIPETSETLVHIGYIVGAWLLVMSVVLFLLMAHDKRLAASRRHRIPESRLFLLAVLGGALGGVLGMQIFRHKTAHTNFILGFPLLALIQWGAVIIVIIPD